MSYILKNTSALVNTKLTDAGRQRLSQGNFNISYFQIGDSDVSYDTLPSTYNQGNSMVLNSAFNAQNITGAPQSNKHNIKYPYFVNGVSGNTYGIPFMDSVVNPIYNTAAPRGFFSGTTTGGITTWSAFTNSDYVINSNYVVDITSLTGGTKITLIDNECSPNPVREYKVGDIITIYFDGKDTDDCVCDEPITPDPCSTSGKIPCVMAMLSCYPILTYRIIEVCNDNIITLDREVPDFSLFYGSCTARVLVYPPTMTEIYDSITPSSHWNDNVINFESLCGIDEVNVNIWNMNIPWSENLAGMGLSQYKSYTDFSSANYLGTKEYLGYQSSSGQTDTDKVYYYNSFDEQVIVSPEEQKAIAIIHYTNNSISYMYGEKFATEPYDPTATINTTGEGRNFKLHIPWLMWHKNPECCLGQTFWIDPPGFDDFNLFQTEYIKSKKNSDMNDPGMRYYHLWDTNPNNNGLPNRIGKVFPDQHLVIIDDEEIIAALSYKSNRNWTLPAPKLSLITPNACGVATSVGEGLLTGNTQYVYITYRLSNSATFTNSLHSNYYVKIQGPNNNCADFGSQDVSIRFGGEFGCLKSFTPITTTTTTYHPLTTTTTTHYPLTTTTTTNIPLNCDMIEGFYADKFEVLVQVVDGDGRPEPDDWRIIDLTYLMTNTTYSGYITEDDLVNTTFIITKDLYDNASLYDLGNYINLTPTNYTGTSLSFGDEYYFYGVLETDIQATIYEMVYKVNLGAYNFQKTSNPGYSQGDPSYITEIGLYNSNKELMIISKLQSPVLRQAIQQFLIKFDF